MVQSKKPVPPGAWKKGKTNNTQPPMKTGKNFVRGNKGPRPLMSLRPGPGPRGPPGFMRPGPYGPPPPPGPPGPYYPPPHHMMGPPGPPGPPGFYPPPYHGPPMWGGPMPPIPPPHMRGPRGPPGPPHGPMRVMVRRGPMLPPQGMRRGAGPPPRRGGPGPIRKPPGKPQAKSPQKKKPEANIDFTDDAIDIQSNKLGTAF